MIPLRMRCDCRQQVCGRLFGRRFDIGYDRFPGTVGYVFRIYFYYLFQNFKIYEVRSTCGGFPSAILRRTRDVGVLRECRAGFRRLDGGERDPGSRRRRWCLDLVRTTSKTMNVMKKSLHFLGCAGLALAATACDGAKEAIGNGEIPPPLRKSGICN